MFPQMEDDADLRKTREKLVLEMRKSKREEVFKQSRKRVTATSTPSSGPVIVLDQRFKQLILNCVAREYNTAQLPFYCGRVGMEEVAGQHEAVIAVRKIISHVESIAAVQVVVDSGAVPHLVALMKQTEYPQLQFEACWIITNIAAGSNAQCESLVEKGCIEILLHLLYTDKAYLTEQALWGIGNIAADCTKFRDEIITKGGRECLLRLVESSSSRTVVRQGTWALSNLCRGAPLPKYELIKPIIPCLCKTIVIDILSGDQLLDALWSIANNTEGVKSRVQRVIEVADFPKKVIDMCYLGNYQILAPCLRIIGNISTGNEAQTNVILNLGVLALVQGLLEHPKSNIRREACWILSNICAGTRKQLAQVLASPSILYKAALLLVQDCADVKKEVCYVFANMCHLSDAHTIYALLQELKIVDNILPLIAQDSDVRLLSVALTALYDFLSLGEKVGKPNPYARMLEKTAGCCERLEALQFHHSTQIYRQIVKILQSFFTLQDNISL